MVESKTTASVLWPAELLQRHHIPGCGSRNPKYLSEGLHSASQHLATLASNSVCVSTWAFSPFILLLCYQQFSSVQSLSRAQLFVTPWTWTNHSPKVISALLSFIPLWFIKGFLEMLYFQMGWGLYKVTQEENVYLWKQIRESLVSGNCDHL